MKRIVAFPFRHHGTLVCPEAKQMLLDAGYELICNDTGEKLSAQAQHEMIKDAFAVVAGTETYDAKMLEGCENLRAVLRFGVGLDNFDLTTMKNMGVQVGVISNNNAVAEFALSLMLAAMKSMPALDAAVREGKWSRYPIQELTGKTVGLLGFGRIGRRLAELLSGFQVRLLACDPYLDDETAARYQAERVSFEKLLAEADIVSLHLPLTKENRHLFNAETFSMMKDGACLVNTSRGPLVDEKALYEALDGGKLALAALDVYEQEPVTKENPLFGLKNVVLSPHCAALSHETNYNAGITCAQSIIEVGKGGSPIYPVR